MAERLQLDTDLSTRTHDGCTYTLWYSPDSKSTYVTVNDHKEGEYYTVPVPEGEAAAEVYRHPWNFPRLGELVVAEGVVLGED